MTMRPLFAVLAASLVTAPALAQSFPSKPITIVVPAAPGGVSDLMGRLMAQRFQSAWGQQVIVENRGGANHVIGAAMVAKAVPDGHTMMVGVNDVLAGHVMLTSVALSASVPPYRAGKAKMLAVGSLKRLPQIPEVPTTAETVPGYEAVTWFGLFTTHGTPPEVIDRINGEVRALFAEQSFLDRVIVPNMFETMVTSPKQFSDYIKRDSLKWGKVLRDANIKVD